jgi:hypothetical protein
MLQQVRGLLPRSMLSSPLEVNTVPPVHVDRHGEVPAQQSLSQDAVARGSRNAVAEMLLLSACDALVHTSSGFSKVAGQWGGIPRDAIRMVDGFMFRCWQQCSRNDAAGVTDTVCGAYTFTSDYHCREPYWVTPGHPGGRPGDVPASMTAMWCS